MNINNKNYQYVGILTIGKSRVLQDNSLPKDEVLPWFFLVMDKKGERRFTFFYKIEQPEEAFYEKPFNIKMSFIMEDMERIIELNQVYNVWRGEESIGKVKITKILK